jgi:hypothetical protein
MSVMNVRRLELTPAEVSGLGKRDLSKPNFPFGKGSFPVLWEENGAPDIRYYRTQIDFAWEKGGRVSERELAAMNALDAVLSREYVRFQFHVDAGETVYMHNTNVLHDQGAARAHRFLGPKRPPHRIRAYASCLN